MLAHLDNRMREESNVKMAAPSQTGSGSITVHPYCKGLIEASCLAALVVVPLFFNIFSFRVFEPDKSALFRSLMYFSAVVFLLPLIVRRIANRAREPFALPRPTAVLRRPLAGPILLYTFAIGVSTIFSISPRTSFFGSFLRDEGSITLFCYPLLLLGFLGVLQSRNRIERAIQIIVLASVPAALYGIMQRYGIDQSVWFERTSKRVFGTVGNPIFFGAYLAMALPLTLRQALMSTRDLFSVSPYKLSHGVLSIIYTGIALAQIAALYFTSSRGPVLAGGIGLLMFAALHLYRWRQRKFAVAVIALPFLLLFALLLTQTLVLNSPNGKSSLGRFAHLFNPEHKTIRVRLLIWESAWQTYSQPHTLRYPDHSIDTFWWLRPVVGYGADTILNADMRFYPAELRKVEKQLNMPDRLHNETWDVLVQHGALGFAGYFLLYLFTFYWAFRWLGLIDKRRWPFFLCAGGGSVLGAVLFVVSEGPSFFGLGIPCGMVIGLFVYVLVKALRDRPDRTGEASQGSGPFRGPDYATASLIIAVLSGIIAHFTEIQVAVSTVTTRMMCWTFLALLLLAGKGFLRNREMAPGEPILLRDALAWALITCALAGTLIYGFSSNFLIRSSKTPGMEGLLGPEAGMMIFLVWLLAVVIPLFTWEREIPFKTNVRYWTWIILASGIVSWAYMAWQTGGQTELMQKTLLRPHDLKGSEYGFGVFLTPYYVFLFLLVFVLGLCLRDIGSFPSLRWRSKATVMTLTLLVPGALAAFGANLRATQGDMCFKGAMGFAMNKHWERAMEHYHRATRLAPWLPRYCFGLSQALQGKAKNAKDAERRDALAREAIRWATRAHEMEPLRSDQAAHVGMLYRWWATTTEDPAVRRARGEQAESYYKTATGLHPTFVHYWCERALVHFLVLNNPGKVDRLLHRGLSVDPEYPWLHQLLGDHYLRLGQKQQDLEARNDLLKRAIAHYERAFIVAGRRGLRNAHHNHMAASRSYYELGDIKGAQHHAIAAYLKSPDKQKNHIQVWMDKLEEEMKQSLQTL